MTLEQLRIFARVAERAHMTRAAASLNLTQSAVSAAISALEQRLGARLFDRVGRGLVLSEAGRLFLPEAKAVLASAEAAALVLEDLAGLRRGALTIFASQTVASYWLPPRLVRFTEAYPNIVLTLNVGNTAQVARAIIDGEAELGFVEGLVDQPLLAHSEVAVDRLAIVAAPSHPLFEIGQIELPALMAERWVLRETGSGTRSAFEQAITERGGDPAALRVVLTLPSNEAVLAAVASGGLVGAVSDLAAAPMIAAGQLRRLPFDLPPRRFELLTDRRRRRGRAAQAFVTQLDLGAAGADQ